MGGTGRRTAKAWTGGRAPPGSSGSGLDIVLDIMETLYNGFDNSKYRPSPLLKQMCDAGYLGRKTGKGFFAYEAAA